VDRVRRKLEEKAEVMKIRSLENKNISTSQPLNISTFQLPDSELITVLKEVKYG
jgi:hypothetical protein